MKSNMFLRKKIDIIAGMRKIYKKLPKNVPKRAIQPNQTHVHNHKKLRKSTQVQVPKMDIQNSNTSASGPDPGALLDPFGPLIGESQQGGGKGGVIIKRSLDRPLNADIGRRILWISHIGVFTSYCVVL